ncbi:MAG: hypothetical protein K6G83_11830 [Lachnospiraceae bacterium]|nr:hypothetical protein [Lachnospiraceae bacterium]
MKKKVSDIVFIAFFLAALIVPAVCINTKAFQVSEIDNEMLTEWPGIDLRLSTVEELEEYADDRIGFREQLVSAYIFLNDKLFHVMTHPLFMYGEEGHIYYKDPSYITAFQRMNTDKHWLDGFVNFIDSTNDYCKSKGIDFLYYLCPDKKTIYPEFFPKSVHVNTENQTVPGYIEEKLQETDVNYIIPIPELTEAKKDQVVYNKLYDATHWNEDGAFIGHELIDREVQSSKDDVPPLTKEDFNRDMKLMESLDIARFPIHEEVPSYTLKNDTSNNMTTYLLPVMEFNTPSFYLHYNNAECGNGHILLIFTDSYFATYSKFYVDRFSEVYFIHRQNLDYIQYYVNLIQPDMVIFETAERSITGEMMPQLVFDEEDLLTEPVDPENPKRYISDYYEPPYDNDLSETLQKDGSPDYLITEAKGIRLTGETENDRKILGLNVNEGDSIVSLNGIVYKEGKNLDIYARLGDEVVLETDYAALETQNDTPEVRPFSVNVQRRYLSEMDIELIAADRDNDIYYLLDTYSVRYEDN